MAITVFIHSSASAPGVNCRLMSATPPTHATSCLTSENLGVPEGPGGLCGLACLLGWMEVGLFEHGQDEGSARQRQMASQIWCQACRDRGLLPGLRQHPEAWRKLLRSFQGDGQVGLGRQKTERSHGPHRGGDHCVWVEKRQPQGVLVLDWV